MTPVGKQDNIPTIPEFFAKKTVLITGCTGFIGKVLLEKLIRSCPDIETIYLIMRNKRTKDVQTRLQDLISYPIFDLCRLERPGFESKLIGVESDVGEIQLGLSEKDYITLVEKVNIVFHAAATIRFNESLSEAIKINTRGTKEIVELCLKMKYLQALVYVSTAYANCDKLEIEEIIYPSHVDWKNTINICEKIDPAIINILQEKYIGSLPNTYVLTKHLAEHVIEHHAFQLPVAICRPSVVTSAWKEPFPGWIDNYNGPVGVLIAYSSGLIKTFMADYNAVPDYVPVDMVVKSIIVSAWKTAVLGSQETRGTIYNCTATFDVKLSIGGVIQIGRGIIDKLPLTNVMWWLKEPRLVKNKTYFRILMLIESVVVAALIDIAMKIKGQRPVLVNIVRKIYLGMLMLSPFTTTTWKFKTQNLLSLHSEVLREDKEQFYLETSNFDQATNYKLGILGARKFLLNDPIENVPKTRRLLIRYSMMFWCLFESNPAYLLNFVP